MVAYSAWYRMTAGHPWAILDIDVFTPYPYGIRGIYHISRLKLIYMINIYLLFILLSVSNVNIIYYRAFVMFSAKSFFYQYIFLICNSFLTDQFKDNPIKF